MAQYTPVPLNTHDEEKEASEVDKEINVRKQWADGWMGQRGSNICWRYSDDRRLKYLCLYGGWQGQSASYDSLRNWPDSSQRGAVSSPVLRWAGLFNRSCGQSKELCAARDMLLSLRLWYYAIHSVYWDGIVSFIYLLVRRMQTQTQNSIFLFFCN